MSQTKKNTRRTATPPPERGSARQERVARRRLDPELRRASTTGRSGGPSPIMLGTLVAVVAGIVLIGYAFLNSPAGSSSSSIAPIRTPAFVTDASIPQSGTSGMTLGQSSAKVTIDLWEDYQCTGCGYFTNNIAPQLVRDYVAKGKAKIVYHDYLIIDQGGGTESLQAANAARCAGDQGKYWQFHDWLFGNQGAEHSGQYSLDRLVAFGRQLNLDMSKFEPCVRDGQHNAEVKAESATSPVKSTPGIFVANKKVVSAQGQDFIPTYGEIAAAIDNALAGAGSGASASPVNSPVASPSAS